MIDEMGDVVEVHKMPQTPHDIAEILQGYTEHFAGIEKVGPSRGRDGRKQGVSSAFTFGFGAGVLYGVLSSCRIPYEEVSPIKWQTLLGCRTGGDKNISKAKAQSLFPSVKITHAVADALLLAEYMRRTRV